MKSETLENIHVQNLSLFKIIVPRSMAFRNVCTEVLRFLTAEKTAYIVSVDFAYCPVSSWF